MPSPDKIHGPLPSLPSAGPDIKIPPPISATPRTPEVTQTLPVQPPPASPIGLPAFGMSSTTIVIALALVAVWAGLLIFVRRLLTQSLVAQFADLGRSRGAGTTLYLFLLVLGTTVIFAALGGFWEELVILISAAVLNVILLILFLVSLLSARSSRQRR